MIDLTTQDLEQQISPFFYPLIPLLVGLRDFFFPLVTHRVNQLKKQPSEPQTAVQIMESAQDHYDEFFKIVDREIALALAPDPAPSPLTGTKRRADPSEIRGDEEVKRTRITAVPEEAELDWRPTDPSENTHQFVLDEMESSGEVGALPELHFKSGAAAASISELLDPESGVFSP